MVKWTLGEVAAMVREGDWERCGEVVGDLLNRGAGCVAWDDDRVRCDECGKLHGDGDECPVQVGEDAADRAEARE